MVKEKKLTKSSIAIIVLALLLVASLIMGMTGAWFTDKKVDDGSETVNFGTVAIDLAKSGSASDVGFYAEEDGTTEITRNLLPGDQVRIKLNVQKATGSEDFFYVVKAKISIFGGALKATDGAYDANGEAATSSNPIILDDAWRGADADSAYAAYGEVDASILLNGETTYGNLYQGATVLVNYEVRAIQQAHLTAEEAFVMLTDDWVETTGLIAIPDLD